MRTVSLVLRRKPDFPFYHADGFIEYIKSLKPGSIYLTVRDPDQQNPGFSLIDGMMNDSELSRLVKDVSVSLSELKGAEEQFDSTISRDPALLAKKKMLDMFTDTIYSYLGGTWKDFGSLNSHDTHTIFKARYLLISSVIPEYISKHYFPILHSVSEKISKLKPGDNDIIVSDIEWSFWYRDNVKSAP